MIDSFPNPVFVLATVDPRTIVSLLIPPVLLGLCIICLHELFTRYRARRLPPGISGLQCLFELPSEKGWLKILKFNQQYGVLSHDHDVCCR